MVGAIVPLASLIGSPFDRPIQPLLVLAILVSCFKASAVWNRLAQEGPRTEAGHFLRRSALAIFVSVTLFLLIGQQIGDDPGYFGDWPILIEVVLGHVIGRLAHAFTPAGAGPAAP
ncbi:hypothetical protein JDO7802_02059 [Jannaschia donghaensis]|uniref:Uncharacterized protein n=2 Tax=Jannaschia donghaensis TaxID=420998 RepID=A0A0M6YI61_9RHOB|nr:hypothetical protein JDO7802_02059 [Jannaschia donghaensis]